jgi:ABC-type molybdenum transport system ATPase subunit/photorepair protein PhrA
MFIRHCIRVDSTNAVCTLCSWWLNRFRHSHTLTLTHLHCAYKHTTEQVKLVLAAAMWNRPHLLVLDEPTNYLDREALGALTIGIKEFGGSVIMISHNQEFLDAICNETWLLEGGRLYTKGEVCCYNYHYSLCYHYCLPKAVLVVSLLSH